MAGELAESDAFAAEATEIFRELGHEHGVLTQTHNRALVAIAAGDYGRARPLLEQTLAASERVGADQHIGNALCDLGVLDLYERRYEEAAPLFARALESALRTGWRINVVYCLRGLAATAAAGGDLETGGATARRLGRDRSGDRRAGSGVRGADLHGDGSTRARSPRRAGDRSGLQRPAER